MSRQGPEGRIQDRVVKYARGLGWKAVKLSTFGPFGTNGEPDYIFVRRQTTLFLIEFKAPGKESTPLQREKQQEWLLAGFRVHVCDDAKWGREIVDNETELWRSGWGNSGIGGTEPTKKRRRKSGTRSRGT